MSAALKKRKLIPINPDILVWARDRVRLSQVAAADAAGVRLDQIQQWERGPKTPTVKQARKLADVYERPFLEFFSAERPDLSAPELVPDFRMHRDAEEPTEQYELILIQSEAEEIRLNAIDLYEVVGEPQPALPTAIYATLEDDPEAIAARARAILKLSVEQQVTLKAKDRDGFVSIIRKAFEDAGILVTKNSGLAHFGARGMCFYADILPIIVFSNEAPSAQAFTLAHELAHIVLKQSAISGPPGSAPAASKRIEDWCDAFAAAFLIPKEALEMLLKKPGTPALTIPDQVTASLAKRFAISEHAMLVRLVNLGYVRANYYWSVKRPQFLAREAQFKSGGRSKYYGSRFRTSRGDLYTGLVLEAWSNGAITNHTASQLMGIKNIAHLDAIRDRFHE
jgi:Zn-dependent peptidase ImmA (M78 family)/transcriptional regulator with XRE-family HTH domain